MGAFQQIKMQTLILSLLLFVYHGYCQDASQYIIGGDAVKELGRWHSVCSLQYRWPNYGISHFCTSSILDKNWIITAAHCVINHPPNEIKYVVDHYLQINNLVIKFKLEKLKIL